MLYLARNIPRILNNILKLSINNCFYCPSGQPMQWIGEKIETSDNGFEKKIDIYQATACEGCELRKSCFKGANYRRIEVNHQLRRQKEMVKELLNSPGGIKHRKKRPADVEAVFGQIKHNNQLTTILSNSKMESIYDHMYLWIVFGSLPPNILERASSFGGYIRMNPSAHK